MPVCGACARRLHSGARRPAAPLGLDRLVGRVRLRGSRPRGRRAGEVPRRPGRGAVAGRRDGRRDGSHGVGSRRSRSTSSRGHRPAAPDGGRAGSTPPSCWPGPSPVGSPTTSTFAASGCSTACPGHRRRGLTGADRRVGPRYVATALGACRSVLVVDDVATTGAHVQPPRRARCTAAGAHTVVREPTARQDSTAAALATWYTDSSAARRTSVATRRSAWTSRSVGKNRSVSSRLDAVAREKLSRVDRFADGARTHRGRLLRAPQTGASTTTRCARCSCTSRATS